LAAEQPRPTNELSSRDLLMGRQVEEGVQELGDERVVPRRIEDITDDHVPEGLDGDVPGPDTREHWQPWRRPEG